MFYYKSNQKCNDLWLYQKTLKMGITCFNNLLPQLDQLLVVSHTFKPLFNNANICQAWKKILPFSLMFELFYLVFFFYPFPIMVETKNQGWNSNLNDYKWQNCWNVSFNNWLKQTFQTITHTMLVWKQVL